MVKNYCPSDRTKDREYFHDNSDTDAHGRASRIAMSKDENDKCTLQVIDIMFKN